MPTMPTDINEREDACHDHLVETDAWCPHHDRLYADVKHGCQDCVRDEIDGGR